jgi:hypothetical protein
MGATFVYRSIRHRPGQDVFRMIPSSAVAVASIDLQPYPSQRATFKKIEESLASDHVSAPYDGMTESVFDDETIASDLKPYLRGNATIAVLAPVRSSDLSKASYVVLVDVTDPHAVKELIGDRITPILRNGMRVFTLETSHTLATVIDHQLIFAHDLRDLYRILDVYHGSDRPIAENEGFRSARHRLPGDANLFVAISNRCDAIHHLAPTGAESWSIASASIRSDGIEFEGNNRPGKVRFMDSVATVSPAKLALGLGYSIFGFAPDFAKKVEPSWMNCFVDGKSPVRVVLSTQEDGSTGFSAFLPVDYNKCINMYNKCMLDGSQHTAAMNGVASRL